MPVLIPPFAFDRPAMVQLAAHSSTTLSTNQKLTKPSIRSTPFDGSAPKPASGSQGPTIVPTVPHSAPMPSSGSQVPDITSSSAKPER